MKDKKKLKDNNHSLLIDSLSNIALIRGESRKEFNKIKDNLEKEFNPASQIESLLCSKIISNVWKIRRLEKFEQKIFLEQQKSSASEYLNRQTWMGIDAKQKRFRSTAKQLHYTEGLKKIQDHQSNLQIELIKTISELKAIKKEKEKK